MSQKRGRDRHANFIKWLDLLITDNMPEQKKNQDCIGFGTEQVVFREHRPPETRTKLHYFTLHERDVKGVICSLNPG